MAADTQSTGNLLGQEEYWNCVSMLIGADYALVDSDLFDALVQTKWRIVQKNGKTYVCGTDFMHRVVLKLDNGVPVDHRNGNGRDNRRSNLRTCTVSQNQWNREKRADSKSGFKGVVRHSCGLWQAEIRTGTRRHYLGLYKEAAQAARAYDYMARLYHGEFARLNFPHEVVDADELVTVCRTKDFEGRCHQNGTNQRSKTLKKDGIR